MKGILIVTAIWFGVGVVMACLTLGDLKCTETMVGVFTLKDLAPIPPFFAACGAISTALASLINSRDEMP